MVEGKGNEKMPFVKYFTGLTYMFSPAERSFLLHMVDIDYKKNSGAYTDWGRTDYMKIMGLNKYNFDKCVKRFIELNLLEKTNNSCRNRVYYSFNIELYNRLVYILSSTCNVNKLIAFCNMNFREKKRSIESITDEEISELASYKG